MKNKILLLLTLLLLSSSFSQQQIVTPVVAESIIQNNTSTKLNTKDFIFKEYGSWDYGIKVAPLELLKQFKQEKFPSTPKDPRRIKVIKIQIEKQAKPIYLFNLISMDKPPCATDSNPFCGDNNIMRLYYTCGNTGGCNHYLYIPESDGKYREVFEETLFVLSSKLLRVSDKLVNNFPCIELVAMTNKDKYEDRVQLRDNNVFVNRLCYNGDKFAVVKTYQEKPK